MRERDAHLCASASHAYGQVLVVGDSDSFSLAKTPAHTWDFWE